MAFTDKKNTGYDVNSPPLIVNTTNKALRMSSNTVIEVTDYLLYKMSFKYVLTGKFKLDFLEVDLKKHFTSSGLKPRS